MNRVLYSGLLVLVLALGVSPARAQAERTVTQAGDYGNLRELVSPMHPAGALGSEPVATEEIGHYHVSAFATFEHQPLSGLPGAGFVPVEQRWTGELAAGVGWHERASSGFVLPLVLAQRGESTGLRSRGLSDLALRNKLLLVLPGELGGFGMSLLTQVTLPTGPSRTWVTEGGPSAEARILTELRLMVLSIRGHVGVHLREPRTVFGERLGTELPLGLALQIRPQLFGLDPEARWLMHVHTRATLAILPSFAAAPLSRGFVGGSVRYSRGEFQLFAGAELSTFGPGPGVLGFLGLQYTPENFDADGDGVLDADDFCPSQAEDRDGEVDDDGCPESGAGGGLGEP
ncbi:MAG: hypothetical protein RJA70_2679 [Pseudomonadota bacterium]|jgi:hypothetical protein